MYLYIICVILFSALGGFLLAEFVRRVAVRQVESFEDISDLTIEPKNGILLEPVKVNHAPRWHAQPQACPDCRNNEKARNCPTCGADWPG